ncbi:MAG: hypothetical protein KA369_09965 [Spirochaetes bacterium]|nr:hypothetical protein [Spirochaetota bacterium]
MHDIKEGLAEIDRRFSDSTLLIYRPDGDQRQLLDRIMIRYIEAPPGEQKDIFEAFRGRYGLLNMLAGYIYDAAERIRSTRDATWLNTALAAASIEESLGKVDQRDMLLALAELYVTAEEAGLDPRPGFETICGLKGFSDYAVVRSRRNKG